MRETVLAVVTKTVFVTEGAWRTRNVLERVRCGGFEDPAGAQVKGRYGVGFSGFDRQKQTLDGETDKRLDIGKGGSSARARMQMRVSQDAEVTYTLILAGP
jgi:opacity protein-like surface antigen